MKKAVSVNQNKGLRALLIMVAAIALFVFAQLLATAFSMRPKASAESPSNELVTEDFEGLTEWTDSALEMFEDGANVALSDNALTGEKSLQAVGTTEGWSNYARSKFKLAPDTVYTLSFEYKALVAAGDFTVFVKDIAGGDFQVALHYASGGSVGYTNLTPSAYQIKRRGAYNLVQLTFATKKGIDLRFGFGMEGQGSVLLDEIRLASGPYLKGSGMTAGEPLFAYNFDTLGFHDSAFALPSTPQAKMFTSSNAINGTYSLSSTPDMPYWGTIFETRPDSVSLKNNTVYTVTLKYKIPVATKPGEFFYLEAKAGSTLHTVRFNEGGIFERGVNEGDDKDKVGYGLNHYTRSYGSYNLIKFTFLNTGDGATVKLGKGDLLGNTPALDNAYIISDDLKICEGIESGDQSGILREFAPEVIEESQYNNAFSGVQAFDGSNASRWVPAPRTDWVGRPDGAALTYIGLRYPAPVRLNYAVVSEAVTAEDGFVLGNKITASAVEAYVNDTWRKLNTLSGEASVGVEKKVIFPDIVATQFRFAVYEASGDPSISDLKFGYAENLAAFCQTSASSFVNEGLSGYNAVDCDVTTQWATATGGEQSIVLHLGKVRSIDAVLLDEAVFDSVEGSPSTRRFTLKYLDTDGLWQTVMDGTTIGPLYVVQFDTVRASAVKLELHESATAGYNFWSIGVYGIGEGGELSFGPDGSLSIEDIKNNSLGLNFPAVSQDDTVSYLVKINGEIFKVIGKDKLASMTKDVKIDNLSGNIARGATATATSDYGSEYDASKTIDGDMTTRWGAQGQGVHMLTLDFLKPHSFDTVLIYEALTAADGFYMGERVRAYRIEIFSGSTWTCVYRGGNIGARAVASFPETVGTKLRLVLTQFIGGEPTIAEIAVQGRDLSTDLNRGRDGADNGDHGPDYSPAKAFDGNPDTRWASNQAAGAYLDVVYPYPTVIDTLILRECINWGKAVNAFTIQYKTADGSFADALNTDGTPAVFGEIGLSVSVNFAPVLTSVLRISFTDTSTAPTLWSVEAYNHTTLSNGAQGAAATATHTDYDLGAQNLTDGNDATRWATATVPTINAPIVLEVTLAQEQEVASFMLYEFLGDESASWRDGPKINDLLVESFVSGEWIEVYQKSSQKALFAGTEIAAFTQVVTASQFKFTVRGTTGDAPSIWEIRLFGGAFEPVKGVSAYSGAVHDGFPVGNILDTDYETRWASSVLGGDSVEIDLGGKKTVDTLILSEALGNYHDYFWGKNVTRFTVYAFTDGAYNQVYRGGEIGFYTQASFSPVVTERIKIDFVCAADKSVTLSEIKLYGRTGTTVQLPYYDYTLDLNNNIAPDANASASSEWSGAFSAVKINDGDDTTRWSAAAAPFDNQWVMLDFGTSRAFNAIAIAEEFQHRVQSFSIETSTDKSNWTTLFEGTRLGAGFRYDFTKINARFVRLNLIKNSDVVTISELKVFYQIDKFDKSEVTVEALKGGQSVGVNATLEASLLKSGSIQGPKYVGVGAAPAEYFVKGLDQYGRNFTANDVAWSITGTVPAGVSVNGDGVLTVSAAAAETTITLQAVSGSLTKTMDVTLYAQNLTAIGILGATSITIPTEGDSVTQFDVTVQDQHAKPIVGAPFSALLVGSDDTVRLTQTAGGFTLTVFASSKLDYVTVSVTSGGVTATNKILLSHYKYAPNTDDGFEIYNGSGVFNRPLYGSHVNDVSNGGFGYFGFAGDLPIGALAWTDGFNALSKRGHIFLGIEDGKWLFEMERIRAVYTPSMMEYTIADSSFVGEIKLTFVMGSAFDGLITKITLPESLSGKLLAVTGGITTKEERKMYDYGNLAGFAFKKQEAEGSTLAPITNGFMLSRKGYDIYGTASGTSTTTAVDASSLGGTVKDVTESEGGDYTMALTRFGGEKNQIYFVLGYEDPATLDALNGFFADTDNGFHEVTDYYKGVRGKFGVETPDKYFNNTVATAVMANDRLFDDPSFLHGVTSWNFPYAGWRSMYGSSIIGWNDRVERSAARFFDQQILDTSVTPTPRDLVEGFMDKTRALGFGAVYDDVYGGNKFYDMTQSLVDMMFYNYEWTGNLDYFKANDFKAYDFVKYHLQWEESVLGREDNLFENFLNMWNTDSIWSSGGGGTTQTAYNLKAYKRMSELATRLGKSADAAFFSSRAAAIEKAMFEHLYSKSDGIFAQFKDLDAYGSGRAHFAPDMATLSVPMDLGLVDNFQSYQLISYALNNFEDLDTVLPLGGKLKFSSNWEPRTMWSISDIYPDETIYFINQMYKNGYADEADAYLKGFYQMFYGSDGPGAIWERQEHTNGVGVGSTDFADTVSPYIKMVGDGMFGIDMHADTNAVTIKPAFPSSWDTAKITGENCGYDYTYTSLDKTETIRISTAKTLDYTVMLKARTSKVKSVTVDGAAAAYTMSPLVDYCYITVDVPAVSSATVEVVYGDGALPTASYPGTVAKGQTFALTSNATIKDVYDPQGMTCGNAAGLSSGAVTLKASVLQGRHTVFVKAVTGDIAVWLPVNVVIKDAAEIDGFTLTAADGGATAVFRLANNTAAPVAFEGKAMLGGQTFAIHSAASAYGFSQQITIKLSAQETKLLSAGTNRLSVFLSSFDTLTADAEGWETVGGAIKQLDLSGAANQRLENLHKQTYSPLPTSELISWTVLPNGRSYWEAHHNNGVTPTADVSLYNKMKTDGGFTAGGVPFKTLNGDKDSVFTSLYDELPDSVTIPVNDTLSKMYFAVVASTNQMQSHIENAVIRINTADGRVIRMPLVNPTNLGDWMWNNVNTPYLPYENSGIVKMLGTNTHALILDFDLGYSADVESIELETLSNEVLTGLLAVSYSDNGAAVEPMGIRIENRDITAAAGASFEVRAALYPEGAAGTLEYAISDGAIAEYRDGVFGALKAGTAVITVSTPDKKFSETVTLTVTDKVAESIRILTPPTKTVYTVGQALTLDGLTAEVVYSDGTTESIILTPEAVTGFDGQSVGTQTLTLRYMGLSVQFDVEVKAAVAPSQPPALSGLAVALITTSSVLVAAAAVIVILLLLKKKGKLGKTKTKK